LQGDLLRSCPIYVPSTGAAPGKADESVSFDVVEYDVIVMTQSCDLEQKKVELVLVCPVWSLSEFEKQTEFVRSGKGKETLRQGNFPGYHLLNKCELKGFEREFAVVDFRTTYSIPVVLITDIAKKQQHRLRLLPPYREHLSQAYARFFMRVGLPVDITPFK
jgi:hypothetical protein